MEKRADIKAKNLSQSDRRTIRLIRRYLKKWRDAGFGWWKIDVNYDYDRDERNRDCAARCKVNWEYRDVSLTFFLPALRGSADEEIENCVLHELCHILVAPLEDYSSDEAKQITETTVTQVAFALEWATSIKIKEKKK